MINITDKSNCSGCHACYNSCPKQCISMEKDSEGFLYPIINRDLCVNCGLCEKVCPFLDVKSFNEPIKVWAAKCDDKKLRFDSSSGGVFSLLARKIIDEGGIVFGAAFSHDFTEVNHQQVNNVVDLDRLRTSKYVQSRIGESYQNVKLLLDAGKKVLFSGVPCQIAGLKKYLRDDYENLLCVDVICHGVPSPELWVKYLSNIEEKQHGIITDVNFRHKKNGWKDFGISRTSDGFEIFASKDTDPYMQMFLRNYSLRPSCFFCRMKANGSDADISLGDFWGIENIAEEMNDGLGTSLVLVNTDKGESIFEDISEQMQRKQVSFDDAKKYNSPIFRSVKKPDAREAFFGDMMYLNFDELAEKYYAPPKMTIKQKMSKTKLWHLIHSIIHGGV